jgi:hypothetical protein
MVRVVQLVERQIVVLVVVGSSPTAHPTQKRQLQKLSFFVVCFPIKIFRGSVPKSLLNFIRKAPCDGGPGGKESEHRYRLPCSLCNACSEGDPQ